MIAAFIVCMWHSLRNGHFISFLIIVFALVIIAYYLIINTLPYFDIELLDRYIGADKESEGIRLGIWSRLFTEYINGNLIEILFGRGPGSCVKVLGWSAHNIFLEQLFQMGLIGLVLIIAFFVRLVKDTILSNNYVGLYLLSALIVLSLTTPIWGHIYFMTPIAIIIYINNSAPLQTNLENIE